MLSTARVGRARASASALASLGGARRHFFIPGARQSWYDHIVVGAGSAGCVLAQRLANTGSKVLLMEAAPQDLYRAPRMPPTKEDGILWSRAPAGDYDAWAERAGDWEWQRERLSDAFEKCERRLPATERGQADDPRAQAFLRACEELGYAQDVGFAEQGMESGVGFLRQLPGHGRHSWARGAYLRPAIEASGPGGQRLEVQEGAQVSRVLFQGRRVTGIEWGDRVIGAGEVVLCAGALGSPQLLLQSGVGASSLLQARGIPVVSDTPGVGANLQDHVSVEVTAAPPQARQGPWRASLEFFEESSQRLSSLFAEEGSRWVAGGTMKSGDNADQEDLLMELVLPQAVHGLGPAVRMTLAAPKSRSKMELKDGSPLVRFVANQDDAARADLEALVSGVRRAEKILAAGSLADPGREMNHKEVLELLATSCVKDERPVGGCSMGHGEMAVVDSELRVRGVEGLRVADASIMPSIVRAPPHASVIAIAERASRLIGKATANQCRTGSQYGKPAVASGGQSESWSLSL